MLRGQDSIVSVGHGALVLRSRVSATALVVSLMWVSIAQAGIEKVNITRIGTTNTLTASIVPPDIFVAASADTGTVADLTVCDSGCDPIILAMVAGDFNWIEILDVHQQSYPEGDPNAGAVEYRSYAKLTPEARQVLENAMTKKQGPTGGPIYNTATHYLDYATFCLAKCVGGEKTELVVVYMEVTETEEGTEPVISEFPVAGGASQLDLNLAAASGAALQGFGWGSGPTEPRGVPAASTWGLLVLTLLLLAGAKGYFGLRKRTKEVV